MGTIIALTWWDYENEIVVHRECLAQCQDVPRKCSENLGSLPEELDFEPRSEGQIGICCVNQEEESVPDRKKQ